MKETAIEMRDIIKKMGHHMPECFFGDNILLTAILAIPTLDDGSAVQTILLFTLWNMRQPNFFLKISTNALQPAFFFVYSTIKVNLHSKRNITE